MTGWYSITPTGPITIGNLTPVGQNSGQVGCRWPPNGHHLAAALDLPGNCQLWGPFWFNGRNLHVPMPHTVYTDKPVRGDKKPQAIYRMQWQDGRWQVQAAHQDSSIEQLADRFLIRTQDLEQLWKAKKLTSTGDLQPIPWDTLTLNHNRRDDYQVAEEGGFFAEMTTLLNPGWSLLVRIFGEFTPPSHSSLGAGRTPVVIQPVDPRLSQRWDMLGAECPDATGAVLLTGALWSKPSAKQSLPYPLDPKPYAYGAGFGIPWQSLKFIRNHNSGEPRSVLTPGEWLTPAGAVYLWNDRTPSGASGPLTDPFKRHVLGYGHLWLFKEATA
jgi:hypothetical protein